jgi:2-polyprenyl-6-methoxyphenol hydroxylase-like FAD-dependent oxidoreductase
MAYRNNNKVLIIGAGLAGLVVAHSCQTQGISYEIFERDASPTAREQGFSIMLHFGLKPIKEFVTYPGAFDDFGKKVSVNTLDPESISMAMLDGLTEEIYFKSRSKDQIGRAYRVNRKRFREWLLKGLYHENVHWDKKLSHYETKEDHIIVYFTDGSSFSGDVLVGADGGLSPVCTQLVGGKEKLEQVTSINPTRTFAGTRWLSKEEWEPFHKYSTCFGIVFGQKKQAQDDDAEQTNLFYSINDIDTSRVDGKSIQVLWYLSRYDIKSKIPTQFENNEECLSMLKGWAKASFKDGTAFQNLILDSPMDTRILPVTLRERKPISELIETDHRVLLVGDAAHSMTPFKGEGKHQINLTSTDLTLMVYIFIYF